MSYIDTRDLSVRLNDLEERDDEENTDDPLDADEIEELAELRDLASEISEWSDGATMIPVDKFEDYAQELAEDIGAIDRDASWPLSHIDWEAAASALAQDYTEVSYQGTDYYVRAS